MQVSRMFEIIYLLLNKKETTAQELAEHFEVSSRTIYRDIEKLSEAGIPIYTCKGKGGGIRLLDHFVLNKSYLSKEEQKDILASLQGMHALQVQELHAVLGKLSAFFGMEEQQWLEINFSPWNSSLVLGDVFNQLKEAILMCHRVQFFYSGGSGITSERDVEPMKLVFRGHSWYLFAWCIHKKDFRYFKLTRMRQVKIGQEQFKRRVIEKEEKEEEGGYSRNNRKVVVQIDVEKAYRVYDEFTETQWEKTEDGHFLVTFEMPENEWLYEYLMTFGAALKVLEPKEVGKELVRRYEQALERYQ